MVGFGWEGREGRRKWVTDQIHLLRFEGTRLDALEQPNQICGPKKVALSPYFARADFYGPNFYLFIFKINQHTLSNLNI
jgi:hypothetical protein